MLDYIAKIREPGLNARIFGIFWHPNESERQCRTGYNRARIWSKLVEDTSGTWGSICDDDYSDTLRAVSKNLQVTLNTKFTLKRIPDNGTVRVYVDGVERTAGVSIKGKVIQLTPPPPEGAVVSVQYVHGAVPILKSFPLQYKPLDGTVAVTVNGANLASNAYSISTSPFAINFNAAPAERAQIVVSYTRDMPLPSQFLLGDTIQPGTLKVSVDGLSTTDYSVNVSNGQLNFNTTPREGAVLEFKYTAVGNPILRYALQANSSGPRDLVAIDTQTNEKLAVRYLNGAVVFNASDFIEGREVTITYDNPARQNLTISLANAPIASTVSAEGGNVLCAGDTYIAVKGRDVNVANCDFPDDISSITIRYKYAAESYQEFAFEASNLPAPGDWQKWKVYVDGEEANGWTRKGNIITFKEALPGDAVVKVVLTQEVK